MKRRKILKERPLGDATHDLAFEFEFRCDGCGGIATRRALTVRDAAFIRDGSLDSEPIYCSKCRA
jgi:hypothetical protein